MEQIDQLINISKLYGANSAFVIAGGGNTSYKNEDTIWIKASGISLADIDASGFVALSREKLDRIASKSYSQDPVTREEEVKKDMEKAILDPANLRPSVETSLHNLIETRFVIHTHPTLVNALMCSVNAQTETTKRFGDRALFMEYTDPGFTLFKKLRERIIQYREKHGETPTIIFLQNHGVFVGADTVEEVHSRYDFIMNTIGEGVDLTLPGCDPAPYHSSYTEVLQRYFSGRNLHASPVRCGLTDHYTSGYEEFLKISRPFTPDMIVYCKSDYLFLGKGLSEEMIVDAVEVFEQEAGYYPKVILEEGGGLVAVEENEKAVRVVMEIYLDLMKISNLSTRFGGPHFMTAEQVRFIDNWEVENYRRSMAKKA